MANMGVSPAASPNLLNDNDLKTMVRKDTDRKLRIELNLGQSCLDESYVNSLSREQLVAFVVTLRKYAKQNHAVRNVVQEFDDYCQGIKSILPVPTGASSVSAPAGQTSELASMMTLMFQFNKEEKKEKEERESQEVSREAETISNIVCASCAFCDFCV